MYLYTKSQNSPHKHSLQTAFFWNFYENPRKCEISPVCSRINCSPGKMREELRSKGVWLTNI